MILAREVWFIAEVSSVTPSSEQTDGISIMFLGTTLSLHLVDTTQEKSAPTKG